MEDRAFDRISRTLAGATSRRQAIKLLGGGIAAGALGATGLTLKEAAAQNPASDLTAIPVRGVVGGISKFVGTFNLDSFIANSNGGLDAVGTLTGTLTNLLTGVTQPVSQLLQLPVTGARGTCQILHLELGPLDLNLLGLRVQLNKVVLNITAQRGGGLLGDLLCAVANLLNGGSPLSGLSTLLNQILGVLSGL